MERVKVLDVIGMPRPVLFEEHHSISSRSGGKYAG